MNLYNKTLQTIVVLEALTYETEFTRLCWQHNNESVSYFLHSSARERHTICILYITLFRLTLGSTFSTRAKQQNASKRMSARSKSFQRTLARSIKYSGARCRCCLVRRLHCTLAGSTFNLWDFAVRVHIQRAFEGLYVVWRSRSRSALHRGLNEKCICFVCCFRKESAQSLRFNVRLKTIASSGWSLW